MAAEQYKARNSPTESSAASPPDERATMWRWTRYAANDTPNAANAPSRVRREEVSQTATMLAAALMTRTTPTPTSVTSAANPHTSSARAPSSMCATAFTGRHGAPDRRPIPTSTPSTAAAHTAPAARAESGDGASSECEGSITRERNPLVQSGGSDPARKTRPQSCGRVLSRYHPPNQGGGGGGVLDEPWLMPVGSGAQSASVLGSHANPPELV